MYPLGTGIGASPADDPPARRRVVISLRRLTRGFSVELADAQSKEVLAGIKSRNEARAEQGLAGSPDTAPFLVPINMETVEQAQARSARANAESAAAIAAQEKPPAPANMLGEGIARSMSSRASAPSSKARQRPSPSWPRRQSDERGHQGASSGTYAGVKTGAASCGCLDSD